MANEKTKKGFFRVCPPAALAFIIFFVLAAALRFIGSRSAGAADLVNGTVGAGIRFVMTCLTYVFPFSVAEMLIFASPVILGLFIWRLVVNIKKGVVSLLRYTVILTSAALLIFGMFLMCIGVAYDCTRPEDKLGLESETLVQNDYYEASKILLVEINKVIDEIGFDETGASVMPYSMKELSDKLNEAYDAMNADVKLTQSIPSRAKPIILSEPMMYTHFSGIYTYFTGEANLNVNYPDYIVVSTAAHEFAHQRGIAPEDEASFIELIVGLYSDDPYIRYSCCLDIYSTISSNLYKASKELYSKLVSEYLDERVRGEFIAYSTMFEKYRDNEVAKVSDKVNDSYLKSQGQSAGTKSYDMVYSLAVSYILNIYAQKK